MNPMNEPVLVVKSNNKDCPSAVVRFLDEGTMRIYLGDRNKPNPDKTVDLTPGEVYTIAKIKDEMLKLTDQLFGYLKSGVGPATSE